MLRVLGVEANIGSMLYPFEERGHKVLGSYDSRGIINEENFHNNFPSSEFIEDPEDLLNYAGKVDVIMSQPSCSKFSNLSRKDRDSYGDGFDIWKYIEEIKPKYFFVESKLDFMQEVKFIEGYTYRLEWISNYYYGNVQKGRNRLWVIANRNDCPFNFYHNEKIHNNTTKSVIEDLPDFDIPAIDHEHIYQPFLKDSISQEYLTLDEAFDMLTSNGKMSYMASDGTTKNRINRRIANPIASTTITGGGTWFHWEKKYPLTIRERARIQGFPDSFTFHGLSKTKKQSGIGKSIPMEFTNHIIDILENPENCEKSKKIVPEPVKLTFFKHSKGLL